MLLMRWRCIWGNIGRGISFEGIDDTEGEEKNTLLQKVLPKVIVVNLSWLGRDAKKALSTTKRKKV